MFEMTPTQAALTLAILGFFPLFFQYLTLLASKPIIAPFIGKISEWLLARVSWLTEDIIKRGVAWSLATLVMVLTAIPFIPAFPMPAVFTADWFILFFTWATNTMMSFVTFFTVLQLFFQYFWKNIFNGSLASKRIATLAEKNS